MARAFGFTLVELVMVILIIGIISVAVMPKWMGSGMSVNYDARRVLNDIRYAQALSMTTGKRYRFVKLSATTYSILNQAGTAIVLLSGGTVATIAGTFSAFTNLPSDLIAFDSEGTPYTTSAIPGTALATTAIIPIVNNGITRSVQITATTGYGVLA